MTYINWLINDKDITIQTLNDYPFEYDALVTGINYIPQAMSFHSLRAKLLT